MEIWDAYYKDGTPAGCDLVRGEPIPNGLYHLVSEIVVKHADGDFLAMQREFNKPIEPGKFEITAGGSVKKGETAIEGAYRELSYDELKTSLNEFPELYCACTADRLRQCDLFKDIEL